MITPAPLVGEIARVIGQDPGTTTGLIVGEVVDRINSEGKRLGARTLIVEVPGGLVMRQEDAVLFQEYVPKQQLAAGMVNLVNIVSTSVVTNMSSKRWKEPSKQCGLTVFEATSIADALEIAKEHAD